MVILRSENEGGKWPGSDNHTSLRTDVSYIVMQMKHALMMPCPVVEMRHMADCCQRSMDALSRVEEALSVIGDDLASLRASVGNCVSLARVYDEEGDTEGLRAVLRCIGLLVGEAFPE